MVSCRVARSVATLLVAAMGLTLLPSQTEACGNAVYREAEERFWVVELAFLSDAGFGLWSVDKATADHQRLFLKKPRGKHFQLGRYHTAMGILRGGDVVAHESKRFKSERQALEWAANVVLTYPRATPVARAEALATRKGAHKRVKKMLEKQHKKGLLVQPEGLGLLAAFLAEEGDSEGAENLLNACSAEATAHYVRTQSGPPEAGMARRRSSLLLFRRIQGLEPDPFQHYDSWKRAVQAEPLASHIRRRCIEQPAARLGKPSI